MSVNCVEETSSSYVPQVIISGMKKNGETALVVFKALAEFWEEHKNSIIVTCAIASFVVLIPSPVSICVLGVWLCYLMGRLHE